MRVEGAPLLAVVVLPTEVAGEDEALAEKLLVGSQLEVVDAAKGQVDVARITVVLHTGQVRHAVCTGEEAHLLVGIAQGYVHAVMAASVGREERCVTLHASRVLESPPIDGHLLRQVDDRVRGNPIVAVSLLRIAPLDVPCAALPAQHERSAQCAVDRLAEQHRLARQSVQDGRHGRQYLNHAAHRIATEEERCGPFTDAHFVDVEGVDLQPVVTAPLLAFLLDAVFGYRNAIEPQSANDGLGESRTDIHRMHAGYLFEGLHQIAREMARKEVLTHHIDGQRRQLLLPRAVTLRDNDLVECYRTNRIGRLLRMDSPCEQYAQRTRKELDTHVFCLKNEWIMNG